MKRYLLALCMCICALSSYTQNIKLKKKGEVDVAFVYKNPFDYFIYPKDRTFEMVISPDFKNKQLDLDESILNVSSMALRVRVWAVLGDIVIDPVFAYKLNMEYLHGDKYSVFFQDISKYPDLVRRYKAIRPTTVNAVVGMGLNPDDKFDFGAYAFFNITNNDLLIGASEKTPTADVPSSTTWGSTVIWVNSDENYRYWFRQPKDFQPSDELKEMGTKFMNAATHAASNAWIKVQAGTAREHRAAGNTYIRLEWPAAEIDAIQEKYLKYQRGEEKPPSKEAEEALAQKDLSKYNNADEWGSAFEDEGKSEAVNDYQKKLIALKSKTRIIKNFDADKYRSIQPFGKTPYFVLNGNDNKQQLVDKRGNLQTIGGYQSFDRLYENTNGEITAEIELSPRQRIEGSTFNWTVSGLDRFFNSPAEAAQVVTDAIERNEAREKEEWAKLSDYEKKQRMNTVQIGASTKYETVKLKRLVTGSKLNILSSKEGYIARFHY
ncbi:MULTISPECIES: hypothetical protein [Niastella]|uniref:SH3b domain-containing protein n=1 Tax=Niastella soli TaxID=2821487 RepID=A0ABS3YXC2_9BACT|nr:hypothetical protein [Niastella soli]MBO9202518.1 hypothetical protein [Niastella soli]